LFAACKKTIILSNKNPKKDTANGNERMLAEKFSL